MRIAIYTSQRLVHFGGFERFVFSLSRYLHGFGHHVEVVTPTESQQSLLQLAMNVAYRNPLSHRDRNMSPSVVANLLDGVPLRETSLLDQYRSLSHSHVIYAKNELVELAPLSAMKMFGILPPIVGGVHTPIWYPAARTLSGRLHNLIYGGPLYDRLIHTASYVHVLNSGDIDRLSRLHHFNINRIRYIPLPISIARVRARTRNDTEPMVTFAGRFSEPKGLDTLLDAAHILHAHWALPIRITIAGAGDHHLTERVMRACQCDPLITYMGHLSEEDVLNLYDRSLCVAVPSRWESFSYACWEPKARGVPVVSSNIPVCRDAVEDYVTGRLVDPNSPAQLADAIRYVFTLYNEQPDRYEAMCAAARAAVGPQFEPSAALGAVADLLDLAARERTK